MSKFTIHTIESAPEAAREELAASTKMYGMTPNLHAILAESPQAFKGYKVLHELFSQTSFDAEELTVVWQTINVEHGCTYCVPAHTGIAHAMKVDPALTEALRNREKMPTGKLQALHETTLKMTRQRGLLSEEDMQEFFDVGYEQRHLLEIVLGLAQKVMSNYTNHLAETPVDRPFQKFAWKK